jgi:hypothetical protein
MRRSKTGKTSFEGEGGTDAETSFTDAVRSICTVKTVVRIPSLGVLIVASNRPLLIVTLLFFL